MSVLRVYPCGGDIASGFQAEARWLEMPALDENRSNPACQFIGIQQLR
jgi:hypothetical protein